MPLLDVTARNASLDNDYGSTRGPNAPDAHEVALYTADPQLGGPEVTGGGYERVTLDSDTAWQPAEDGAKHTATGITFAPSTDAWGVITHWGLIDAADHSTTWDTGSFAVPIDANTPGGVLYLDSGALTVFYASNLDPNAV